MILRAGLIQMAQTNRAKIGINKSKTGINKIKKVRPETRSYF
jgi:hypothetical protein